MLNHRGLTPVQVGAVTQNDAGIGMVDLFAGITGIGQCIVRDFQRQKLIGLLTIDGIRHDPEFHRIEPV